MASFSQSVSGGSVPYGGQGFNSTDGTWSAIRSGNGTGYAITTVTARLVAKSTSGQYNIMQRGMCGFDLQTSLFPPDLYIATSAYVRLGMQSTVNGSMWSNASHEGVGMVLCNDGSKSFSDSEQEDYEAIYNGGFTECSSRLPYTSWSNGSPHDFHLNSAGLDYLNTIRTKADFTDEAYFGFVLGGDLDNYAPTWVSNDTHECTFDGRTGTYPPTLYVTYHPLVQVRIGTAWKPCWTGWIKIGTGWRPLEDGQIKIGSAWKGR